MEFPEDAPMKPPRSYCTSLGACFLILRRFTPLKQTDATPPESSKEMAKRFLEQPPVPAYITMKGPYFHSELGEGIKSILIYEFDQSKYSEANQFIITRFTKYIGVPGFTYSINTWLEAKEALKAIGMG